jgi:hypothetical protein
MQSIIEGPPEEGDPRRPLGKRLLWFIALWAGSLLAVAAIAYGLRALLM